MDATDSRFMRRALALGRRGWGQVAPNPLVGAVVVRDGRIVGQGYHAAYGGDHAEVMALREAGDGARGATLYVTLEPCAHQGRTPACTGAILRAGIRRVVAAVADPNPTAGGGLTWLAAHGVQVESGVEEEAARELAASFHARFSRDRPWLTLKLALSLDGALADHTGQPGWITNARSRREVHRLRAASDAVAVGIGTALADDPLLTVRGVRPPRRPPLRVIFDPSARLPVQSALVRTIHEAPLLLLVRDRESAAARRLGEAGVTVVQSTSLDHSLRELFDRGVHSLLVEGGAGMAGALLTANLVDRLIIFQGPVILGAGALGAFSSAPPATATGATRLRVVARRRFGDDLMTEYAMDSGTCSPD